MLQLFTSDEFAQWFAALDDRAAEEVATALEVVERLGPERALPGSHEWLLWYEHPSFSRAALSRVLQVHLDAWLSFQEYAKRIVEQLESQRFVTRIARLPAAQATAVLEAVTRIKRACDPRRRLFEARMGRPPSAQDARAELRRWYLAALSAAQLEVEDLPEHSLGLREFSLRALAPALRVLYGVDAQRERALLVWGEPLDRCAYGASTRRAEHIWSAFLQGERAASARPALR